LPKQNQCYEAKLDSDSFAFMVHEGQSPATAPPKRCHRPRLGSALCFAAS
jgi:hypothetical protein